MKSQPSYPSASAPSVLRGLEGPLLRHLERLRQRGRLAEAGFQESPGSVIEDTEAGRLIGELCLGGVEDAGKGHRPQYATTLDRATKAFDLTEFEQQILHLASAGEFDSRYGRLFAYLNDAALQSRPTVGLALAVFTTTREAADEAVRLLRPDGRLRWFGLLSVDGEGPFADRALRVPESFLARLLGAPSKWDLSASSRPPDGWVTNAQRRAIGRELATAVLDAPQPAPLGIVSGPDGSGRESFLRELCAASNRPLLAIDLAELDAPEALATVRREAGWHNAAVAIRCPARSVPKPVAEFLTTLNAPAFLITPPGVSLAALELRRGAVVAELKGFTRREQIELWQKATERIPRTENFSSVGVADRFDMGPADIQQVVNTSLSLARARRGADAAVEAADLFEVCDRMRQEWFGALAQQIDCPFLLGDLIVPESVSREIRLAVTWARYRTTVLDDWGLLARVPNGRSLSCLFSGPPGTGKTMAAQVIARELGRRLFRVDLSQIVNKYIGETEKNIRQVFEAARALDVVLLFDEAEGLFGKRTEVRDANDRYANLETGFLLQCLEQHPGISILATNLRGNIDDAFLRRLHVVADFPLPGPDERRRLWESFLPSGVPRGKDVDLDYLAADFALSGGDIRNAVMTAAFLGASDGGQIRMQHLVYGTWREMTKSGRAVAPEAFGVWAPHVPQGIGAARRRGRGSPSSGDAGAP